MPSSHSPIATHAGSRPRAGEPADTFVQRAPSQASSGPVKRTLLKLINSAESLVRGQGSAPGSDLAIRPAEASFSAAHQPGSTRRLSLALQGGGAFGAFTWGVLDRLLEEDDLAFDAVSGASAGAINAVLLASGLAEGGRASAQRALHAFWQRASEAAPRQRGGVAAAITTHVLSPYQFNPFNLNP